MSIRRPASAVAAFAPLLVAGLAFSAPDDGVPRAAALAAPVPAFQLEKSPSASATGAFDSALLAPLPAYAQVRSTNFSGWGDTGIYAGTLQGRFPQLCRLAGPDDSLRPLTSFPGRITGIYLNPVPGRKNFLYTEDDGGNEEFRLRLYDLRTGRSRALGAPPGRVEGIVWNDSGTAFAYSHTPAGTDRWDLRLDRIDGRDTLVLSLPGTWSAMDLRPDGKRMLVQKYLSASEAELFILDLTDGKTTPLLPGEKPAYADHAQWIRVPGRDASWAVAFTSDRDGEFTRVYLTDAEGGRPVAWSDPVPWDVEWVDLAPDRKTMIYSLDEEGCSRLYATEAPNGPLSARKGKPRARSLANIPPGVINDVVFRPPAAGGRAAASGAGEFAFTLNTAAYPGDIYTYDMARAETTRWTRSETGGLPASSFRSPKLVRYPTFDSLPADPAQGGRPKRGKAGMRRTIPAWLYLPDAKAFPGPRPTLILVHGGPEMQARPGFDPFLQFLVGRLGFIVAQPNVRGSSGYGRTWQKADDGYLRMNSVRDLGALIDWVGRVKPERPGGPYPDAARVAVSGRSYGGFMSLSALVEYGSKLRAGISTVGISHFPTFLKKTSGYRRDLRRVEYGDERDPRMAAFLDSISPLTRMDRITTPLLLCHGRNDPRVPYEESERIFAALKGRKIPVWFLTFPDEGHGVRDQESQLAQWRVTAEFLMRELGTPVY